MLRVVTRPLLDHTAYNFCKLTFQFNLVLTVLVNIAPYKCTGKNIACNINHGTILHIIGRSTFYCYGTRNMPILKKHLI